MLEQELQAARLYISVPECGIDGLAEVLQVGPCPAVQHIPGARVVTGTWRHHSAQVLDLTITGLASPIGTTANHRFWSKDRQDFVRADELREGERLLGLDGHVHRVRRAEPSPIPRDVFNLEIHGSHVFAVTSEGAIVHNGAWSHWIGSHVEDLADNILRKKYPNLDFLGPIQRKGGNGLDLVFRTKGGTYVFFEVKKWGTPLSPLQKSSGYRKYFVDELRKAAFLWKSIDGRQKDLAKAILEDIRHNRAMIRGRVLHIDPCGKRFSIGAWR